jgi:hypothetical protein
MLLCELQLHNNLSTDLLLVVLCLISLLSLKLLLVLDLRGADKVTVDFVSGQGPVGKGLVGQGVSLNVDNTNI